MKTPTYWGKRGFIARLLLPFAGLYWLASKIRQLLATPQEMPIPVICVGNITAGGSGKTPTVAALTELLLEIGKHAHIISRGYGGAPQKHPLLVDASTHTVHITGDEPLLLSQIAPTWVCPDRVASARSAANAGADLVLMDDGLQHPHIAKTLSLLVIDTHSAFGNGFLLPAGPLRETLGHALPRIDAAILIGDKREAVERLLPAALPRFYAALAPTLSLESFTERPTIAFAGLGRPEKFFNMLAKSGITPAVTLPYADHHPYTAEDISKLQALKATYGATLLTTEKDMVRLPANFQNQVTAIPIRLQWDNPQAVTHWLKERLG